MNNTVSPNEPSTKMDSNNLIVFLIKNKWKIIVPCLLVGILAAVASFLIEEKYQSSVVLFAADSSSLGDMIMNNNSRESILEFGEKEKAEQLLQIINSDQIRSTIIANHNLFEHYEIPRDAPGANTLIQKEYDSNISAALTKFGSIKIDVLDKDPALASVMANDISNLVDTVSTRLKNQRTIAAYDLAESEFKSLKGEIVILEDSLRALRIRGVYDYDTQIATLNEQYGIAILEGKNGPAKRLKEEMAELAKYGDAFHNWQENLEEAYDRMLIVRSGFEKLKIERNSVITPKFVVNKAQVSDKKAYPVRWLIVAVSLIAAFVLVVFLLLVAETIKSLRKSGALN